MRRTLSIAATATTLALALAACGGSSSSKGGSGGGADRTTTTTAAASGGGAFGELAAKAKDANVKVTYRSGGKDGELTIAQFDGDSFISFGNDAFYSVGGKSVTCQGTGADAQCFELPGNADLAGTIVQSFFGAYASVFDEVRSSSSALGSVRTSTSRETIAGRSAECATISAKALGQSGDVSVCLDAETGFLLRAGGSGAGAIEATAFRSSTAADVTPPATPQGMPGA
jgi:hypothetical protein